MTAALFIISILWITLGSFLVLYTEKTKDILKKMFYTDKVKWLSFLPFIFGIILLAGALYYRKMFWLAFILGLMGIAKGIFIVAAPSRHVKGLLEWWFTRARDKTLRMFGLIAVILGSALLSYL